MLRIGKKFLDQMVCHSLDGYPLEVCGLLAGVVDGSVILLVHGRAFRGVMRGMSEESARETGHEKAD